MTRSSKRSVLFLATVAAAIAVVGAAAFACTNLATLNLSSGSGIPGSSVTVTGSSFATGSEGAAPSPVSLRWSRPDGTVLTEASPDAAGNFSASFTLPQAEPGQYVIVATQRDAEGKDEFGTPARAAFEVLGPGGESAAPPASAPAAGTGSESSSTGAIVLVAVLGVLGLGLFAVGSMSMASELRRRKAPTPERVQRG